LGIRLHNGQSGRPPLDERHAQFPAKRHALLAGAVLMPCPIQHFGCVLFVFPSPDNSKDNASMDFPTDNLDSDGIVETAFSLPAETSKGQSLIPSSAFKVKDERRTNQKMRHPDKYEESANYKDARRLHAVQPSGDINGPGPYEDGCKT